MYQSVEGRELITLTGGGVSLRGTFHRPANQAGQRSSLTSEQDRLGIIFLNSLSLPRAASGDSAVYWAEAFANCGYPSFRFDLPGLGDTAGNIPMELLNFINAGGYAHITAAKVRELVECFHLSGVVLVGHCAGTVSAIEAAALRTQECKGLVLLDPYFHLPQAVRPKVRRQLSAWALESRLGGWVSDIYDSLRKIRLMWRGKTLPQNANLPLLNALREVASSGTPILVLTAPARKSNGTTPRAGEFDYLKYILEIAGRRSRVEVELVEGTDHSFANRKGRLAVRLLVERWLRVHFPLSRQEVRWVNALSDLAPR